MTSVVTQSNAAVITVDGQNLSGTDSDDVALICSNITGWHDAAPKRANFTDRDNADGQFDGPVYKSGRVISLSGWCQAPNRNLAAKAQRRLTRLFAGGRLSTLVIDDPDYGWLSARVRLSDGPQIDWNTSALQWPWQLQLTAPDPLKYGPETAIATGLPTLSGGLVWPLFSPSNVMNFGTPGEDGRVSLDNPGTADTWPVFVIAGPISGGFTITDVSTGRIVQYADSVPAGSVLTIRSSTGYASLNGADRTGSIVVGQWFPVPAESGIDVQLTALGAAGQSGSLTAIVRPAYE